MGGGTDVSRVEPPLVEDILKRTRRLISARPEASAIWRDDQVIDNAGLALAIDACRSKLVEGGAKRGDPVLLSFRDHGLFVPSIIACLEQGFPILPLDPRVPIDRVRNMLDRVPVRTALFDEAGAEAANLTSGALCQLDVTVFASSSVPYDVGGSNCMGPDELATIFFTSGSTGSPKAIAGRLLGVSAFVDWEINALQGCGELRVAQLSSAAFDGFLKDLFVPLGAGGTVCIPEDVDLTLYPEALAEWIQRANVNVLHLVPTTCRKLLGVIEPGQLQSVKAIVLAGEAIRPEDVTELLNAFGEEVRLLNLYGPTETTLTKTYHRLTSADAAAASVPIGRPMPGVAVRLVEEGGRVCASGESGEILLVTELGSLGYIGDPDATAQRFTVDPLGTGAPAYRTGDIGRFNSSGELEFLGRRDNQVKIRGVRIEPEEVEAVMVRHPAVVHAAAISELGPDEEPRLVCFCELSFETDTTSLLDHAGKYLPRWMLPSRIVALSGLPLTANGKLDRVALRSWEEASPLVVRPDARDNLEAQISIVFANTLGISSVDPSASFFVLGGHSLLALELVAALHSGLGISLTLRDFFEHSSVEALGAHLRNLGGDSDAC